MTVIDPDLSLEAEGGLRLVRPAEDHVDAIVAACSDPDVARFTRVPSPYTPDDARWWIDLATRDAVAGTGLHRLVLDADGSVVGSCGLPSIDARDRNGEVGYWVATWARRRHVATRAARAVCRWAFEVHGLERLGLLAATINPASNGVARTLGFTHEGTLRQSHLEGGTDTPARFDMHLWGLLPGELR